MTHIESVPPEDRRKRAALRSAAVRRKYQSRSVFHVPQFNDAVRARQDKAELGDAMQSVRPPKYMKNPNVNSL